MFRPHSSMWILSDTNILSCFINQVQFTITTVTSWGLWLKMKKKIVYLSFAEEQVWVYYSSIISIRISRSPINTILYFAFSSLQVYLGKIMPNTLWNFVNQIFLNAWRKSSNQQKYINNSLTHWWQILRLIPTKSW